MRPARLSGFLILAGCAAARPGPVSTPDVAQVADGDSEQAALLRRALAPIVEAVKAEGYGAEGTLTAGFLAPSSRLVQPISIAPRTCVAIVSIASATVSDLDAAIYAADGRALAEDDTTGARPIVRLCTGEQRLEAYLAFYAFQGTGSFAAQRLERPIDRADALALAELESQTPSSEQTPGFSELLRGLHGRGYEDDGPITEVPLVAGSALRVAIEVKSGRCYGALADGDRLRVRLLDAAGRELALGVGGTGPAALQYCAREDADLLLELSSDGAERSARLARLHATQAAVGSARAVWLGEPSPAFAIGVRAAKEARSDLRCTGELASLLPSTPLNQGGLIERELKVAGCTRIEATLRDGLSVLTARVEDAAGALLAERDLLGPRDALSFCVQRAGAVQLTMIARAGFGAVALARQACGD